MWLPTTSRTRTRWAIHVSVFRPFRCPRQPASTFLRVDNRTNSGRGVLAIHIDQLRDPFLDSQYRELTSALGTSTVKENEFAKIESLFNTELEESETTTGLSSVFGDFLQQPLPPERRRVVHGDPPDGARKRHFHGGVVQLLLPLAGRSAAEHQRFGRGHGGFREHPLRRNRQAQRQDLRLRARGRKRRTTFGTGATCCSTSFRKR